MKVRDEINKYSSEEDKPVLLWLLTYYRWSSEFSLVASYSLHQYGKYSYQTNRVWQPTVEGFVLYSQRSVVEPIKSLPCLFNFFRQMKP